MFPNRHVLTVYHGQWHQHQVCSVDNVCSKVAGMTEVTLLVCFQLFFCAKRVPLDSFCTLNHDETLVSWSTLDVSLLQHFVTLQTDFYEPVHAKHATGSCSIDPFKPQACVCTHKTHPHTLHQCPKTIHAIQKNTLQLHTNIRIYLGPSSVAIACP